MGVRDPRYYPKRFCTGGRDLWYYSKSSVWVLETCGVIQKVLLPKKKTPGHVYHLDLELSNMSRD